MRGRAQGSRSQRSRPKLEKLVRRTGRRTERPARKAKDWPAIDAPALGARREVRLRAGRSLTGPGIES